MFEGIENIWEVFFLWENVFISSIPEEEKDITLLGHLHGATFEFYYETKGTEGNIGDGPPPAPQRNNRTRLCSKYRKLDYRKMTGEQNVTSILNARFVTWWVTWRLHVDLMVGEWLWIEWNSPGRRESEKRWPSNCFSRRLVRYCFFAVGRSQCPNKMHQWRGFNETTSSEKSWSYSYLSPRDCHASSRNSPKENTSHGEVSHYSPQEGGW